MRSPCGRPARLPCTFTRATAPVSRRSASGRATLQWRRSAQPLRDCRWGSRPRRRSTRDPFARAAAVRAWRQPPDFISVNLSELGWQGIMRAAVHAGIGIEAGLSTGADAEEFARSPFVHQVVRALVEVDGGAEDARAIAELIPAGVPQLWHGYGERTWEVLAAAQAAGVDTRVGLEDVLVLPDGRSAAGNAELVAAALALTSGAGS